MTTTNLSDFKVGDVFLVRSIGVAQIIEINDYEIRYQWIDNDPIWYGTYGAGSNQRDLSKTWIKTEHPNSSITCSDCKQFCQQACRWLK